MIVVSSLFEYGNKILRGSQGAKSRPNNIETGEDPGAAYELVDDAHDPRPTAIPSSIVNTVSSYGGAADDGRTETGSSTPTARGGNEGGKEISAESKKRRNHRYKVLFGLALPFALQSLDTTIIASALPFIAADFGTLTWSSANTFTRSTGYEYSTADC